MLEIYNLKESHKVAIPYIQKTHKLWIQIAIHINTTNRPPKTGTKQGHDINQPTIHFCKAGNKNGFYIFEWLNSKKQRRIFYNM